MIYTKTIKLRLRIDILPPTYDMDLNYIINGIIARACRLLDRCKLKYEIDCKEL